MAVLKDEMRWGRGAFLAQVFGDGISFVEACLLLWSGNLYIVLVLLGEVWIFIISFSLFLLFLFRNWLVSR